MRLRGTIQGAWIEENPPRSELIEMILRVRDVEPEAAETLVVPSGLLLSDPGLEPRAIAGQNFEAEVELSGDGRWLVRFLQLGEPG